MSKEAHISESDGFFKGTDRSIAWYIVNSAGSPQTMTGWALQLNIYRRGAGSTAVVSKTTGAGEITIDNGDGTDDRATAVILDTDTDNLEAGTFRYTLQRTDSGYEDMLAYGNFVILHPRGSV